MRHRQERPQVRRPDEQLARPAHRHLGSGAKIVRQPLQFSQRSQSLAIEHARHGEEDAHDGLSQPDETGGVFVRFQPQQPRRKAARIGARRQGIRSLSSW